MFPFANDISPPHYAAVDSQEPFSCSSGLCSQIVFCCNAALLLLLFFFSNFLRNQMCKISEVKDHEIEQISLNPASCCCCSLQGVAGQQLEGGLVGWERAELIQEGSVGFYSCGCSLKSTAFGFWRIRILRRESLTCGRFQLPVWQDRDRHCCTSLL